MNLTDYQCGTCKHPFYEHRESREWQLLNPRRKKNLNGCTHKGCDCQHADESHVKKPGKKKATAQPKAAPVTVTGYTFTTQDIEKARDIQALSWAKVAEALGLKSPSAARKAYTELTGRPHNTSTPIVARKPRSKAAGSSGGSARSASPNAVVVDTHPHWHVDSDQDEIIAKLTPLYGDDGKATYIPVITVERTGGFTESVGIQQLIAFDFSKDEKHLAVSLYDAFNGAYRCFYVDHIIGVS